MGKPVSTAQSHAVIATFMNSVQWDKLDAETLQFIIKHPREAGRMFTAAMMRPWTKHLRPVYSAWSSVILSAPERARRIAESYDVFMDYLDPAFHQQQFQEEDLSCADRLLDVWEVVEFGNARDILGGFDFKTISFNQSQVVDIADMHAKLLKDSGAMNCIPLEASGVPYIAIITFSARGRMSVRTKHYEFDMQYQKGARFILPRVQG